MDKNTVLNAVAFMEKCLLEEGIAVSKIILFGSQADERANHESDVDVAIISEDFQGKDIFERAALTKEAEIRTIRKFMLPLDIITLTLEELESETSLISEYVKNGKVLSGVRSK